MSDSLITLREVEAADIARRREVAGIEESTEAAAGSAADDKAAPNGAENCESTDTVKDTEPRPLKVPERLVGLALSGGGARAASVGLGFLQAAHQRGLLRFVDYLSTVSGGGYVGSYLSSHVLMNKQPINQLNFPVQPLNEGNKQPPRVMRFIYGGRFLFRPWAFANKYLIGLFFNNIAFISGMIAICAGVAFLWRCLDYEYVREFAAIFDLNYDLYMPFWPFFVFFALWILAWMASYYRRAAEAPGYWASYFLYCATASLLIGLALLLGNGDITVGGFSSYTGNQEVSVGSGFTRAFLVLVGSALLPFLAPTRLLKSGMQPEKWWEPYVFGVACTALLVGIPLFLIAVFGREDISGYVENRDPDFVWQDIRDADAFGELMSGLDRAHSECQESIQITIPDEFESVILNQLEEKREMEGVGTVAIAPITLHELGEALQYASARFKRATHELSGAPDGWKRRNDPNRFRRAVLLVTGGLVAQSDESDKSDESDDRGTRASEYFACRNNLLKTKEGICEILNHNVLTLGTLSNRDVRNALFSQEGSEGIPISEDKRLNPLLRTADLAGMSGDPKALDDWDPLKKKQLNRWILEAANPNAFWDSDNTYRRIVIDHDQWTRAKWIAFGLAVFLFVGIWVDVNGTSMHRFYRQRLGAAFIETTPGSKRDIPLSDLRTTDYGAPYHLINASVSHLRSSLSPLQSAYIDEQAEPDEDPRSIDTFTFSRRFCGAQSTGYEATEKYETYLRNNVSLADATALSGAAVSPLIVNNWLFGLLMIVSNLRLGQWLPNPRKGRPWMYASILAIFRDLLRPPSERDYCFVSDGGVSENLGLVSLLKRRCSLIIVLDAAYDPNHEFKDLARVIRAVRIHSGVQICTLEDDESQIDLSPLELDTKAKYCSRHFVTARIKYPEQEFEGTLEPAKDGILIYMKSSITGDEPIDLLQYRKESRDFPHHGTGDITYDDRQVESYRQLGFHIGEAIGKLLPDNLWGQNNLDFEEIRTRATNDYGSLKKSKAAAKEREEEALRSREEWSSRLKELVKESERLGSLFEKSLSARSTEWEQMNETHLKLVALLQSLDAKAETVAESAAESKIEEELHGIVDTHKESASSMRDLVANAGRLLDQLSESKARPNDLVGASEKPHRPKSSGKASRKKPARKKTPK